MSIKTGYITESQAMRILAALDVNAAEIMFMMDRAQSQGTSTKDTFRETTVACFKDMPFPYVVFSGRQPSFIGRDYNGWRCIAQFPAARDHIVIICQLEPGFMVWSLYGSDGFSAYANGSKCYHLRSAMQEAMRRLSKVTYPSDDYFDVKYENDLAGRS